MLDRIKLNVVWICKQSIYICGTLFSLVAVITSFITWEEMGIERQKRLWIFSAIILCSFITATIYIFVFKRKNIIWKKGNGKLQVCYGDVIKLGNHKHSKGKQIIVIPVNTCFDTLVDNDIAMVEKPLISPKSIHGQWVNVMINSGISLEELDSKIARSIQVHNLQPVKSYTREEKLRGKLDEYPLGTVVPVSLKGIESNDKSAQSVYDTYSAIIDSLQKEIDKNDLSFEEKKYIIEQMKDVADKVDKKDSENKKWIAGMAVIAGMVVVGVAASLASVLGGNTHVESIDSDDDNAV